MVVQVKMDKKECKKKLVKMTREGVSVANMAEEFGVSAQTIRNWATEFGIYDEMKSRTPLYCACHGKVKQTLAKLLKEGKNLPQIAEALHITQKGLRAAITENGLDEAYEKVKFANRSNRRRKERDEKTEWWKKTLTEMFDKGMTVNQIKDELGVTKRTIYLRMRQCGFGKKIRAHNMPNRKEIAERKVRVREMLKEGKTVSEIARAENMQYSNTVRVINQVKEEDANK